MPDRKPTPDAPSAPDLSKATARERQFWRTQRPILHDEARESITRLINSHFKNDAERARISIPANPDRDDDLIAHSYVEQQRERDAERDELVAALQWIGKTAKGIEPRVFDEMMRDLMLIDDRCRAVLAKVKP